MVDFFAGTPFVHDSAQKTIVEAGRTASWPKFLSKSLQWHKMCFFAVKFRARFPRAKLKTAFSFWTFDRHSPSAHKGLREGLQKDKAYDSG